MMISTPFISYLAVTVNFSLDFLANNQICDLLLNLLNTQVKSFGYFSHINYLIGCHILNQSLLSYLANHVVDSVTKEQIKFQRMCN